MIAEEYIFGKTQSQGGGRSWEILKKFSRIFEDTYFVDGGFNIFLYVKCFRTSFHCFGFYFTRIMTDGQS